jgi:hypothetical protein
MSDIISGDHDSLNKKVNSLVASKNQSVNDGVSYETGFEELFQNVLAGVPQRSSLSANKSLEKTTPGSSQSITNTKKVQSTTKKPSTPNDPNAAFVANGGAVVVTIQTSYSDYNNKIYWSTDNFKTRHYIGIDNHVGGTRNIGIFPAGTRIEFGIDNGVGGFFKTGAAAKNSDGLVHALVTKSKGTSTIRFEDMQGGGDGNFSDAIIRVRNKPIPPVNKPETGVGGDWRNTKVGGVTNVEPFWPIINPVNPSTSIDSLVNWLTTSADLDAITKNPKKCSDLILYLMQLINNKQTSMELSYGDSIKQQSKSDNEVSSVDIHWLGALHKS